jgi:hypothetical protein
MVSSLDVCLFGMKTPPGPRMLQPPPPPTDRQREPERRTFATDGVANSAAAGYLVLPLLHVTTVVPMPRQVAAEPVLAVMVRPGPWVGAQDLKATTGVRERVAA